MTAPNNEIRNWLARHPHPATVRVTLADGTKKTVRIGLTRSRWRDAESTIGDDAVRAEALDNDGVSLRVWEAEGVELAEEAKKKGQTAEELMLVRFAELVTEVADKAVMRHTEFVNVAFAQLGELVKLYATRNAMLEKAWHKLLIDSSEAQAEAMQGSESDAVIGGLMQMGMQSLAAKPNGAAKANAKGKPNGH